MEAGCGDVEDGFEGWDEVGVSGEQDCYVVGGLGPEPDQVDGKGDVDAFFLGGAGWPVRRVP